MEVLALFRPIQHYFDRFFWQRFPSAIPRKTTENLKKFRGILETSPEERGFRLLLTKSASDALLIGTTKEKA